MKTNIRAQVTLLLIFTLLATAGCGDSDKTEAFAAEDIGRFSDSAVAESLMRIEGQQERNPYLAYEHNVSIEVDEANLESSFQNTLKKCAEDAEHACEIHNSNLNTGDYPSAEIRVRIKKEGVAGFIQAASENNKVIQQNVSAEDLAAPIMDNEKRLKMLESYQNKLIELESRSAKDIDSLIKVSSEIAKTQSELEAAKGENEFLMKRINLDIVSISFQTDPEDSILEPIGEAFEDFAHNLSQGIATAVTVIAYLIPWILILIGLYFLLRWLWSKKKR
jgi:hypothetical protein